MAAGGDGDNFPAQTAEMVTCLLLIRRFRGDGGRIFPAYSVAPVVRTGAHLPHGGLIDLRKSGLGPGSKLAPAKAGGRDDAEGRR
jgi:hypothetical protein